MVLIKMTRSEIIRDLPQAFREQNDIEEMSDKKLIAAWRRQGTHAGTWEWDYVKIVQED